MSRPALTEFQEKVIRVLARSKQRLIPNEVGYALINARVIVPNRSRVSAQAAAMMVIKPLAKLQKMGLIRYDEPDMGRRGYAVTSAGRELISEMDEKEPTNA